MKVAEKIRARRRALGFTQESFALHARLARSYYGRIEQGSQNMALKTLFLVAAHLNVKPAELLSDVTVDDCWEDERVSRADTAR
jgi:transcriptional regulator with XRE-family HTH domain